MNWSVLIPIIAQEGLPVAQAIYQKWASGNPPTAADFEELRALSQQTAVDRIKAVLVKNGVLLDSDKAKELLAFAGG
jgi:hypothetical protein